MPGMLFLFLFGREIVLIFLGEKWTGSIVIFQIFALAGFIRPAISTAGFVMISCGMTRKYLILGVVNSLIIILGIIVGVHWGLVGIALGTVIANYVFFLPVAYLAFRDTPISVGLFLTSILPSVICSLVMGLTTTSFSSLHLIQNSFLAFVASGVVAVASYLAAWMVIPGGKGKVRELYTEVTSAIGKAA
jgi:PST family polysaccharide transporter